VPTFDALPSDVKKTAIKQYGENEARGACVITHNSKVYIMANINGSEAEPIILNEIKGYSRMDSYQYK